MQEHYPVPNHLRPEAARWKQNADGSEAVSLAGVQSLYEVVIENVSKPDFYRRIAEEMRANPEVTYLDMTTGVISQYVFNSICTLTNLEWLSLGQVRASDISNLRNLTSLRCLSIDCFASTSSISSVRNLGLLESLTIGLGKNVASIAELEANTLTSLVALDIGEGPETTLTIDSLEPIGSIASLKYLVIGRLRPIDNSLSAIAELPNLKVLQIASEARMSASELDRVAATGVAVSVF